MDSSSTLMFYQRLSNSHIKYTDVISLSPSPSLSLSLSLSLSHNITVLLTFITLNNFNLIRKPWTSAMLLQLQPLGEHDNRGQYLTLSYFTTLHCTSAIYYGLQFSIHTLTAEWFGDQSTRIITLKHYFITNYYNIFPLLKT